MSSSIDKRIVEMEFDNAQFERGISTSLKSLDNLEKGLKLDGATKGLENLGKTAEGMNFNGLQSGIYAVQEKFSALEVVGITALQRITNQAISTGEALVKSLSVDQISAGWSKYADKTTSVATLVSQGYDLETINEQLDLLNTFTDETSYNFTDMVSNISKFTAAGQDLPKSVTAMEGIATWAALSGQNAATASRAMYQLSQAMGAGVMKRQDYASIQNANMDTAEFRQHCIDAGIALGTLKKNADGTFSTIVKGVKSVNFTQSQFMESLTEGQWLTSDVMMKVFTSYASAANGIFDEADKRGILVSQAIDEIHDKAEELKTATMSSDDATNAAIKALGYTLEDGTAQFDAFALKALEAAQKARTFNDAIDSVKDAVSTGWMKTFEIIFGDADQATRLWTDLSEDLYSIFAEGGDERNDYLQQLMGEQSNIITSEQWKTVEESTNASDALQKALMDTARTHGVAIDEMINDQTSFADSLSKGWLTSNILTETLKKFTDDTIVSTDALNSKLEEYKKIAADVIRGDYGNGAARKKALADAGQDYATIQGMVNKMLAGTEITINDLNEEQLKSIGYTDEQVEALKELAKQAEETGTPLNELITSLDKPSGRELLIESMSNVLHGLMGVLNNVKEAWSEAFPAPSVDAAYSALEALNKFAAKLVLSEENGEKLKNSLRGLFDAFGIVTDIVGKLTDGAMRILESVMSDVDINILDVTESIGKSITSTREWINENETLNGAIDGVVNAVIGWITAAKNWIREHQVVSKIGDALSKAFTIISDVIKKVVSVVTEWTTSAKDWIREHQVVVKIGNVLSKIFTTLSSAARKVVDVVSGWIKAIKNWVTEHQVVIKIGNVVSKVFTTIFDVAGKAVNAISKWWESFSQMPIVQQAIEKFKEVFFDLLDRAGQAIEDFVPNVQDFFSNFNGFDSLDFSNVSGLFSTFTDAASNGLGSVIDKLDVLKNKISGFSSSIKEKFSPLITFIEKFVGDFKQLTSKGLKKFTFGKVMTALTGIGVISALTKLGDALTAVKNSTDDLKNGLTGVLGGLKGVLVSYQKEIQSKSIINIAIAIGILAVSLIALAHLPAEDLKTAAIALGGVTVALAGLVAAIGLFAKNLPSTKGGNSMGLLANGLGIMAMAASLLIIVESLKEIQNLNVDLSSILTTIGIVVAIIGTLAGGIFLINKINPSLNVSTALTLVAYAVALRLVLTVLGDLSELPLDETLKALGKMSIMMVTVAAVARIAGKGSLGGSASMLAAVYSLKMVLDMMDRIADMPLKKLIKSAGTLAGLMVVMNFLMAGMGTAGEHADKAGKSMLMMSAAMYIIVEVIRNLEDIDGGTIAKGFTVISFVSALMGIMTVLSKFSGANADKAGIAMISLAGAIAVLTVSLRLMEGLDTDSLIRNITAIGALMAMMAGLMVVSQFANGDYKSIIAIAGAVAALAAVMAVMSTMDTDSLARSTVALDSIMGMLALVIAATNGVDGKAIASIVVLTAALAAISFMLYQLASMPNPEDLLPVATSLSEVLIALSAAMRIMGSMSLAGIATGSIGIIAAVATITAVLEALGALMKLDIFKENLDNAITAMEKIGNAIGSFIGGIVGGIGTAATNALPKIADNLTDFADGMGTFVTFTKNIPNNFADRVGIIVSGLAEFVKGSFLTGLRRLADTTISFDKVGTQLTSLGTAVKGMAQATNGVAIDRLGATAEAVASVAGILSEIPTTGGLWSHIVGEKMDMKAFGNQLTDFASSMVRYCEIINGKDGALALDQDAIESSKAAADILIELAKASPKFSEANKLLFGEIALDELGGQLESFAEAMVNYSSIINGGNGKSSLDTAAIQASQAASDILIDLANKAPTFSTAKKHIFGEIALDELGGQLGIFATGLVRYSQILCGGYGGSKFDSAAVEASANAVSMVVDIANKMPDADSFPGWLTGTNKINMADFASDLTQFGEALVSYGQQCCMLSVVSMDDASTCIKNLVDALKLVGDINFEALRMLSETLNTFTPNSSFTDMFAGAKEAMSGIGEDLIKALNEGITNNATSVATNAQTLVNNFVSEMTNNISSNTTMIGSTIDTLCSDLLTIIGDKEESFTTAVETICNSMIQAVNDKQESFGTSATELCRAAASKIYDEYQNWHTAGGFLAIGLAEGIRDGKSEVINAAIEVSSEALKASKDTLQEKSPSKATYQFGRFFDLGLANGMYDYADQVAMASEAISTEAISAAQLIADNISDTLDEDIDYRPTIRPVLDLDDVESGSTRFASLFGGRSLHLASSIERAMKAVPITELPVDADSTNNQNGGVTNYNFTQNNYSPKALSRIDLYRQTNNQFAMMKERGK